MVSDYRYFHWFQWRFLISDGEQLQMFYWFQWRFLIMISDGEQLQMFLLVSMEVSDIWWWATTDVFIGFNGGFWYLMVSNYRYFYWFQWRFLISDGEQLQMFYWFQWRFLIVISDGEQLQIFLLVSMEVSDIWWWATTDVFIGFNGGFWYLMVSNYRYFYWFQWRFLISDGEQLQMFLLVSMEVSDIWWWATTDIFIGFNGGFWYLMVSNYRCFYWFQWRFLISDGEQLQIFLLVSMEVSDIWWWATTDVLLVSMEVSDIWWWATTDVFIGFNGGFWYLMVSDYMFSRGSFFPFMFYYV